MKKLAVGLTGTHGTGKTFIVDEIEKRAVDLGISTYKIISPTRYVKSLGFQNNQNLDFQNEFMCIALRTERQRRAFLTENHPGTDKYLILADRVGLDELSYTRESIERQTKESSNKRGMELWPLEQLRRLYELTESMIYTETSSYWDQVFYKPIHPDFLPVVDEARPGELDYQQDIDYWMKYHWEQLPDELAGELDIDRDKAVEQVWNYISEEFDV